MSVPRRPRGPAYSNPLESRLPGPPSTSSSEVDRAVQAYHEYCQQQQQPDTHPREPRPTRRPASLPVPAKSARSSSPSQRGLRPFLRHQLWCVWAGVKDASAWPTCLIVVYGSRTIQQRVLKCVVLNGILFLGSIVFYNIVILRLNDLLSHMAFVITGWTQAALGAAGSAGRLGTASTATTPLAVEVLYYLITFAYNAFWLYPVYCFSFLLNAIWYQEIADRVYTMRGGEPSRAPLTYSGMLQNIASEIYRILLFFTYVVWASLIYLVPYVGPLGSFIYFCWIYAFYCFEYQWINKNWSFEKRLDYLESRWAYFLGFGLPCTLCTFFSPLFVSAGIFAFLFPMYIIMANIAQPLPRRSDPAPRLRNVPTRLPIFALSKNINALLLNQFRRYQYRPQS
ncbi:hypothetical protein IWQ60_001020 [Tieghemiomyces parasiticus]|uniref:Etoposide-induced protein 2.4-domain-containing protein n=1 Tax=Tieghemiomyces parasiticus TaxID=78921 RepID=A0A9W8AKK1_9FUNG|nr:hypothetical protein IWQ60_001020 [Tieghemiomyces parasiticus]